MNKKAILVFTALFLIPLVFASVDFTPIEDITFSETDTLQSVTDRGANTDNEISINNNLIVEATAGSTGVIRATHDTYHVNQDVGVINARFPTNDASTYGSMSMGRYGGGNRGVGLRFQQVEGVDRLLFRGSASAGAMVWSQPEANAQLLIDIPTRSFRFTNSLLTPMNPNVDLGGPFINIRWRNFYVQNAYLTGNMGIGTNTPNQKLQVVGNINASGTVYASAFESHSPIALGIDSDVGYTRLCYQATNGDVVLQSIQKINNVYQPVYNVDTQGICDKNIITESYSVTEFSEISGEIKEIEIIHNTYEKLYSKQQSQEIIKKIRNSLEFWETNREYAIAEMFQYQGKGYEVIQEHTSQEDWLPNTVPALYKTLILHEYNEVTAWVQPQGSHDCYPMDAQVTYDGQTYQSTHSCNVWQPPILWSVVE